MLTSVRDTKNMPPNTCSYCNITFLKKYYTPVKNPFCSTKCKALWQKANFKAPWKGKKQPKEQTLKISQNPMRNQKISKARKGMKFTEEHLKNLSLAFRGRTPWNKGKKLGKNKKHSEFMKKFLSNPENHWNYVDGRSKRVSPKRYGDDWDKIRRIIYIRDNFTCQKCGKTKIVLDIHHIKPFLESFDNSLNNLVALCRSCHMKEENNLRRKTKVKNKIVVEYEDFKEIEKRMRK